METFPPSLRGTGKEREKERGRGSARLQPALRTPTNIHVNCSLREINISDKLPMPVSRAVMKVCWRGLGNTQITANRLSGVDVWGRGNTCVHTCTAVSLSDGCKGPLTNRVNLTFSSIYEFTASRFYKHKHIIKV